MWLLYFSFVEDKQVRVAISKRISLTSSTIPEIPSSGRKGKKAWEYGGFRIYSDFAEILLHQSIDELHDLSRRWGRNQDFIKTPASKCIKVFLFIIKLMRIIFSA